MRNPFVIAGWVVFLAIGLLVFERRAKAQATEIKLAKAKKELRALVRTSPAPTDENSSVIEKDLSITREALIAWRSAMIPESEEWIEWRKISPPVRRTDAFFDLASGVESLRQLAIENHVKIRTDERFGFSTYAHEGPESDLIGAVFEQRRAISHLVATLFKAQPEELVSVQRENPASSEIPQKTKNVSEPLLRDFFVPDARISLRTNDLIRTKSFRISFSGGTYALRNFLTEVSSGRLPFVIRSVEAESLPAGGVGLPKAIEARWENSSDTPENKAIVSPIALKFTVIVELIEFTTDASTLPAPTRGSLRTS